MPNPLWVDARDYLTNKGVPVTTGNLNSAMGFLAQNVDARPSYAKASPDAATSIGAGLGMPTDDLVRPVQDTGYLNLAQHVPNRASSNPEMRGSEASPIPQGITATPLPGSVSYSPTSYTPPQAQARSQPRSQGSPNRTEKTASTRSQPKALPTNNRAETASARSDPIVSPVSTGSDPNIHGAPDNVATALPPNVNPAIPDVSNGAYAPGGLDVDSIGPGALLGAGGLGAALLAMILSKGRGGRVPNAPRIPGVGASPLEKAVSPPQALLPPPQKLLTGPDPLANAAPYGTPGVMADRPPNQSVTPYSGAAPQTTPPQLEDLIAELATAPPNRNIMGTTRGTKPPTPPPARPKVPASPTGTPTFSPNQQAEVEQMMADMAKKQPPAPPRQAPKTKTTVKIDKKKAAKK
jgi:hypothetical protein